MAEKMYLLTLMDLESWKQERIWVRTSCPHEWQEWVDTFDFDPPLTIQNPSVVRVQEFLCDFVPVEVSSTNPL